MKSSILSSIMIFGMAVSGGVWADQAVQNDSASGTTDSKVLTQTHDKKASERQSKKGEVKKGGRPTAQDEGKISN
ncbi:hypothetical protein [Pseudomonas sp. ICMP 561]|uniref:hypothetical protein n=1 Tax=Pseudomonas sp. ICMP 561 TaxID=1718918 RepID=UPI000C076552|nr:hypothetical protein [Pseudomonas sp. ICMP 561]PHN17198.1 hypothetical protein AO242_21120 [Pseudomonas sp. ICMP 561]